MSLAGKLEDVPLADVMQFIHLGRRTGTLTLQRGDDRAQVNFHTGAIVGAWYERSKRLGELLLANGLLDRSQIEEALERQHSESPHRSLGQILIEESFVDADQVRDAIKMQIEQTIYELVTWTYGSFTFELDTMERVVDDVAVFPSELFPDIDLNTQMVLLEAARIFDERARDEVLAGEKGSASSDVSAEKPKGGVVRAQEAADLFDETGELPPDVVPDDRLSVLDEYEGPGQTIPGRLELVSVADDDFAKRLAAEVAKRGGRTEIVDLDTVGMSASNEVVIAAFDLRTGDLSPEDVGLVLKRTPGLSGICILEDVTQAADAYTAGAAAVVPRAVAAVAGCYQNMVRFRTASANPMSDPSGGDPRGAFAKLRRVVADLRSGVFSASVALNLMNVISESVERAVLFLVKRDELSALGAFGFTAQRESLAERTKGLTVSLDRESALTSAISARQPLDLTFDEASLPNELVDLIGPPRSGQVVVFPVLGSDRVILVVYTDNGQLERPIREIDILDLAASEVGIAFENELLRRQLSERRG